MQWLILILLIIDLLFTMGLVGAQADISKKLERRDHMPNELMGNFIKTPVKKPKIRKKK